jgi:hypothetical protein
MEADTFFTNHLNFTIRELTKNVMTDKLFNKSETCAEHVFERLVDMHTSTCVEIGRAAMLGDKDKVFDLVKKLAIDAIHQVAEEEAIKATDEYEAMEAFEWERADIEFERRRDITLGA